MLSLAEPFRKLTGSRHCLANQKQANSAQLFCLLKVQCNPDSLNDRLVKFTLLTE